MTGKISEKTAWAVIGLTLIILLNLALRFHLADVPLERDEGEYAYAGWLILQGSPPFAEAYNMKMPGIYAGYALVLKLFGSTDVGIRMGVGVLNGLTTLFLFLGFRRRFGPETAAVAAAFFSVLSLSAAMQGIMANSEHFVLFFFSAALWALPWAVGAGTAAPAFLSGLLFGLAFMMKQHAVFFILFGGLNLLYSAWGRSRRFGFLARRLGLFTLGVFLPFILACFYLRAAGVFDRFWFWTFDYAGEYVALTPVWSGLKSLLRRMRDMALDFPLVLLGGAWGLVTARRMGLSRDNLFFLYSLVFFSVAAFCPGLYFRPHYFLLAAPALGLGAALALENLVAKRSARLGPAARAGLLAGLFLVAASFQFAAKRDLYFNSSPDQVSRKIYGPFEPFPEARRAALFIRDHSRPGDLVAVLGSEPQIYFYSERRSAVGYMYHYPLIENHEFARSMERDLIAQVEAARPEYLVFVNFPDLWPLPRMAGMMKWMEDFLAADYVRVGVIDSPCQDAGAVEATPVWGGKALGYVPKSSCWLMVYRKRA
ncbi:MAG: glycosyltransferase family 39 protein [Pseudomonadota bacterium]